MYFIMLNDSSCNHPLVLKTSDMEGITVHIVPHDR